MTHDELVARAVAWLYGRGKCRFVFPELTSYTKEQPDAIGFNAYGSTLIECKVSRSDFINDQKKSFRHYPEAGMGNRRYYLMLPGLVKPEELPDRWGLLEVRGKRIFLIVKSGRFGSPHAKYQEWHIMYSALRRVQIRGDLKKVFSARHGGDELYKG